MNQLLIRFGKKVQVDIFKFIQMKLLLKTEIIGGVGGSAVANEKKVK